MALPHSVGFQNISCLCSVSSVFPVDPVIAPNAERGCNPSIAANEETTEEVNAPRQKSDERSYANNDDHALCGTPITRYGGVSVSNQSFHS